MNVIMENTVIVQLVQVDAFIMMEKELLMHVFQAGLGNVEPCQKDLGVVQLQEL